MAELDARRAEILAYAARRIQRQIRTHLTRKEFITVRRATIQMQKHWRGNFLFLDESIYAELFVKDVRHLFPINQKQVKSI